VTTKEAEVAPPPETSAVERKDREDLRRAFRYCLGVFLVARVGLSIVALAGVALLPSLASPGAAGWPGAEVGPGLHNLVTAWQRYDANWFLGIATGGYLDGNGSAAFFPLYPLAIRFVSPILGGHPLAAAILISNAAYLGALTLLYRLTASEYDERIARRAVVYLAVFPTAFFFLAPYSESLFLLFAVAALWGARRGQWEVAGIAGALAAATRNIGILLAVPIAVEAIQQFREGKRAELTRGLLAVAATGVGTIAYLLFWQRFSGDWLAPLHQQANWQRTFSYPWDTVVDATREGFRWFGVYPGGYHFLDWLIVSPMLVAGVWVGLRARPLYGVYVWASLLAPLSFIFGPRPFMSLPRFLLPIFPLFWAPAVLAGRKKGVHEAVIAVSATLLGIGLILFVNSYFFF
jgi:hypothetical protein